MTRKELLTSIVISHGECDYSWCRECPLNASHMCSENKSSNVVSAKCMLDGIYKREQSDPLRVYDAMHGYARAEALGTIDDYHSRQNRGVSDARMMRLIDDLKSGEFSKKEVDKIVDIAIDYQYSLEEELKHCPFCGSEAYVYDEVMENGTIHGVACTECMAEMSYADRSECIEKWNERA